MELERIKGKAEEACSRLRADIQSIKQQKVGAQRLARWPAGLGPFACWSG